MYFYPIYTTSTSLILNYMCYLWVHHTIITRQTYYSHAYNIIILISSTTFQTYDITLCNTLCEHGHIPLYYLRKQKKKKKYIKSKEINKNKIKY